MDWEGGQEFLLTVMHGCMATVRGRVQDGGVPPSLANFS